MDSLPGDLVQVQPGHGIDGIGHLEARAVRLPDQDAGIAYLASLRGLAEPSADIKKAGGIK